MLRNWRTWYFHENGLFEVLKYFIRDKEGQDCEESLEMPILKRCLVRSESIEIIFVFFTVSPHLFYEQFSKYFVNKWIMKTRFCAFDKRIGNRIKIRVVDCFSKIFAVVQKIISWVYVCLLYTSDAADEDISV